jgi:hypothetical protein
MPDDNKADMPDDNKADKQTFVQQKTAAKAKTVEEMLKGTTAGAIWDEIKDKPIEMFGLPNQHVSLHAVPSAIDTEKLYLTTRATAALPAIELAIGNKYTVDLADRYIVVARTVIPITKR